MSCSNDFSVEVKQGGDCWKPASISEYQDDMLSVYVRDNPSAALSVALESVRWPKDTNADSNSELKEKMEVEYCEKHSNFTSNFIYTWKIGEIGESQEDKCLVKTSHGELWLPRKLIFPCVQGLNFRDESVKIFSICIDVEGKPKEKSFNADSLKLICEELKARSVCYKENENKLLVLSTEPQTIKLCEIYRDKNKKEIPLEVHCKQGNKKTYSETLTVDISMVDIATNNCIRFANKVSGIRSIDLNGCSFLIVGSNPDAVKKAIGILDVVTVVEEFPSCNLNQVKGIKMNKPIGLKEIKLLHENATAMKVELVGTRNSVDIAKQKLNSSMSTRLGIRKKPQNDYRSQENGVQVRYKTPDYDSYYQRPYHRNMSVPSCPQSSSLVSSESDNSPLSPQQPFHPKFPITAVKNPINTGYPQTEGSVPYTAIPKIHENSKELKHRPRKAPRSVSGDCTNSEWQHNNVSRGGPKNFAPKKKIPSDPNHNGKEEACSASLEDLVIVEDSVFTNSESTDPPSKQ